eukprot:gene15312-10948_t
MASSDVGQRRHPRRRQGQGESLRQRASRVAPVVLPGRTTAFKVNTTKVQPRAATGASGALNFSSTNASRSDAASSTTAATRDQKHVDGVRNDYRSKRFVREWIRMMQNEKLLAAVPFADQTICELLSPDVFDSRLFEQKKSSGDYNSAGNPVKGILYEAAIASFKDTASMEYLHWQHPVDLASKKVAICVMGLPGSSDPRAGASWRDQVLRVLDADLYVVSSAWPIDGWPAAKAAMVDDFDVLAFFNSHVPTWNQSAQGDNFFNG